MKRTIRQLSREEIFLLAEDITEKGLEKQQITVSSLSISKYAEKLLKYISSMQESLNDILEDEEIEMLQNMKDDVLSIEKYNTMIGACASTEEHIYDVMNNKNLWK